MEFIFFPKVFPTLSQLWPLPVKSEASFLGIRIACLSDALCMSLFDMNFFIYIYLLLFLRHEVKSEKGGKKIRLRQSFRSENVRPASYLSNSTKYGTRWNTIGDIDWFNIHWAKEISSFICCLPRTWGSYGSPQLLFFCSKYHLTV